MIQDTMFLGICFIAGFRREHFTTLPRVFIFMALTAILFTALGSAIGAMRHDMQAFQFVVGFLIMPLFLWSGAIFPLANLPPALAVATSLHPAHLRRGWLAAITHRRRSLRPGDRFCRADGLCHPAGRFRQLPVLPNPTLSFSRS
jgi:ABC-type multidrug transport system permease subunit